MHINNFQSAFKTDGGNYCNVISLAFGFVHLDIFTATAPFSSLRCLLCKHHLVRKHNLAAFFYRLSKQTRHNRNLGGNVILNSLRRWLDMDDLLVLNASETVNGPESAW